jgi:hypothetical protein
MACILDMVRTMLIFENVADLLACANAILGDEETWRVAGQGRTKPRFALSAVVSGGYRDLLINCVFGGMVVEIQLCLRTFSTIKLRSHAFYALWRVVVEWTEEHTYGKRGEVTLTDAIRHLDSESPRDGLTYYYLGEDSKHDGEEERQRAEERILEEGTPDHIAWQAYAASMPQGRLEAELVDHVEGVVFSDREWSEEEKMEQIRLKLINLADPAKRAGSLKSLKTIASSSDWSRLSFEQKAQRQAEGKAAFEASDAGREYADTVAWQAYEASITPEALEAELVDHKEGLVFSDRKKTEEEKMQEMGYNLTDLADPAQRSSQLKWLKTILSSSDWSRLSFEEKAQRQADLGFSLMVLRY